jgi:hypothetical protein
MTRVTAVGVATCALLAVACGSSSKTTTAQKTTTTPVENKSSTAPPSNDLPPIPDLDHDPRYVQCIRYSHAVERAEACTALAPAIRAEIRKTSDGLTAEIAERYMDGNDGASTNQRCDDETAKIVAVAAGPCGWKDARP